MIKSHSFWHVRLIWKSRIHLTCMSLNCGRKPTQVQGKQVNAEIPHSNPSVSAEYNAFVISKMHLMMLTSRKYCFVLFFWGFFFNLNSWIIVVVGLHSSSVAFSHKTDFQCKISLQSICTKEIKCNLKNDKLVTVMRNLLKEKLLPDAQNKTPKLRTGAYRKIWPFTARLKSYTEK